MSNFEPGQGGGVAVNATADGSGNGSQSAFQELDFLLSISQLSNGTSGIADAIPAILWATDAAGESNVYNQRWYELAGLEPGNLPQDYWKTMVHPADQERVFQHWKNCVQTGQDYTIQYRFMRASDKSYRWHLVRGVPTKDNAGVITGWAGYAIDIDDYKQIEASLRESESLFRAIFDSIKDAVLMMDNAGCFVRCNPAAETLFGVSGQQLVGSHFSQYMERGFDSRGAWSAFTIGSLHDLELSIIQPGGSVRIVEGHGVRNITPGRHVAVLHDITNRRREERQTQELLEREKNIAQVLQKAILPASPPALVSGFQIAVKYRPASREAEIGGDFYDVFELDQDRFCVVIGDVAGKGLSAAIRVAAARYSIRSYAFLEAVPSKVLELANNALCKDSTEESRFLTAFFAIINTRTHQMHYACAGHEPALIVSEKGDVSDLKFGGLPIGLLPDTIYPDFILPISLNDTLVVVTDGITEAKSDTTELFEREGVSRIAKDNRHRPSSFVAEAILTAATCHAGGSLQDDAAILVMRRQEEIQ